MIDSAKMIDCAKRRALAAMRMAILPSISEPFPPEKSPLWPIK
jgi:hypothetical protein